MKFKILLSITMFTTNIFSMDLPKFTNSRLASICEDASLPATAMATPSPSTTRSSAISTASKSPDVFFATAACLNHQLSETFERTKEQERQSPINIQKVTKLYQKLLVQRNKLKAAEKEMLEHCSIKQIALYKKLTKF